MASEWIQFETCWESCVTQAHTHTKSFLKPSVHLINWWWVLLCLHDLWQSPQNYVSPEPILFSCGHSYSLWCTKKLHDKLTYHVNHVLEVFLTDKMVINSIFLSGVGPPSGVTHSVEKDRNIKCETQKLSHLQPLNRSSMGAMSR